MQLFRKIFYYLLRNHDLSVPVSPHCKEENLAETVQMLDLGRNTAKNKARMVGRVVLLSVFILPSGVENKSKANNCFLFFIFYF